MKDYAEAAAYLGVTERFMRTLVAEKRIAHHKLGKFVRFSDGDLDRYAEATRVEPGDPHPLLCDLAKVTPLRRAAPTPLRAKQQRPG